MDSSILKIIGRNRPLLDTDLQTHRDELNRLVEESSFLVVGGAGSIGQAVVKELFSRNPRRLDVVDISENNLVELVRDIRSSLGYIDGEFRTLPLDCGGREFLAFADRQEPYDYVLNLSAMKHVRSEKDPFTLMRMFQTNVVNTELLLDLARRWDVRKYFGVSTDKAANPVNAMGATKLVTELCMIRASEAVNVSSARFANVAFSDGSLLHGFTQRIAKRQPISAPCDVKRYFITPGEAGQLCLLSCLLAENRGNVVPKMRDDFVLTDFRSIAERYLESIGYRACPCDSEDEARRRVDELASKGEWPCYFFQSDTTGEKPYEEFYTESETVDTQRFTGAAVVKMDRENVGEALSNFLAALEDLQHKGEFTKRDLIGLLAELLPEFSHLETNKYLDARM